jgi:dTDP-4-amino-4,6-dideoxygalactose transaminase
MLGSHPADLTIRRGIPSSFISKYRQPMPVTVTRPSMPPIDAYVGLLHGIWERRWLTNNGELHCELETKLAEYLGVKHLSLFCNGATALLVALHALRINAGEVITTPFTFPATTHVLHWNQVRPVFCDIEPETFNLDPNCVERLISSDTRAILAVHVYGNPCNVDALQAIAERHGLLVIYDAAHAFGVRMNEQSVLAYGDMSMLSFHATKVFSTIEGGALIASSAAQRQRINSLKNFGIADEETIIGPGINGKMNEMQAAFGLLQLKSVDEEIGKRQTISQTYRRALSQVRGIQVLQDMPGVRHNYGYFPVLVDADAYGLSRDELYALLREFNIVARKYFHPLVSHAPCYAALPSASAQNLPVAERVASQVLCLPIYGDLDLTTVEMICDLIEQLPQFGRKH